MLSCQVLEDGTRRGLTEFRSVGFSGLCPPSGIHRYFFPLYALDTMLALPANTRKRDLEEAVRGHTLGHGVLLARYSHRS